MKSLVRRELFSCVAAALAALIVAATGDAARAGKHRHHRSGNRQQARQKLKRQCQHLCSTVHQNCLWQCSALGYANDYCNPYCAIARDSCRMGCGY